MCILSLFFILMNVGCSPSAVTQNPTQTVLIKPSATIQPTQTPIQTPTQSSKQSPTEILEISTPDCLTAGGIIQDINFPSEILMDDFHYKIYLPPCYGVIPGQKYPVLYLLHGLTFDHSQWIRLGLADLMDALIETGHISSFIVVLPLESRFDPPELSLYGDVLINELVPHVDNNYPTLGEKSYRGIGGLSRGAAWAVRIGFEHASLFSKVGAHSLPLFNADVNQIQTWLTQIPKEDLPLFFIDIGRDDMDMKTASTFALQLDQKAVPHEWYLFNNGHSESYWSDHLAHYLRWYARDW